MGDPRGLLRDAVTDRRAIIGAVIIAVAVGAMLLIARAEDSSAPPAGPEARAEPAGVPAPVAGLVDSMSDEELADQVLLLGFEGVDGTAPFLGELGTRQLGGVLVDSRNWTDSATGTALVGAIRATGREDDRIPPLVTAAQEGGRYRSFGDLPPEQTSLEIAGSGSVEATEEWARAAAASLHSAGFDLDLFPIADVASLDSPIADRAFSDDPAAVAELTAAAVRGCEAEELACAPLHFPGLGAASGDTDTGPATVGLDAASLEARDLMPFRAAIDAGAPALVLSLAFYAAYDAVTPGALSEPIAIGLLRDQLGFDGVAITDDLGAGAVRSSDSVPKAAVRALDAGADMLQIGAPEDALGVREAIVEAVGSGLLDHDRLAQAAGRVLELKRTLGVLRPSQLAP